MLLKSCAILATCGAAGLPCLVDAGPPEASWETADFDSR